MDGRGRPLCIVHCWRHLAAATGLLATATVICRAGSTRPATNGNKRRRHLLPFVYSKASLGLRAWPLSQFARIAGAAKRLARKCANGANLIWRNESPTVAADWRPAGQCRVRLPVPVWPGRRLK
jgi:hypothetical protein